MQTEATAELRVDDAPATPHSYDSPNKEGVYADVPLVPVTLSGGNICHFLVAHTREGFIPGHKFFTRQPRNLLNAPPMATQHAFAKRDFALLFCCSNALHFFVDHHPAIERLVTWARENLSPEGFATLRDTPIAQRFAKEFAGSNADARATAAVTAPQPAGSEPSPDPAGHVPIGERINRAVARTDAAKPAATAAPEDPVVAQPAAVALVGAAITAPRYAELAITDVGPGANPRKNRDVTKQAELVENLRNTPLLHPIVVRDLGEGREGKPDTKRFEIIAGEGRWLAYQALGRETIEARVFAGVDGATALAWALVENLQRSDLNPIEEAEGFADLSRMGWTPARMAEQTGKDKRTIRRALGLMKLPEEIREMIRAGKLSARHARALARWVVRPGFEDGDELGEFTARPEVCLVIAHVVVECQISGRALEAESIPAQAIEQLRREKLIAEIPANYATRYEAPEASRFIVGGMLYTFDVDHWKAAKKELDREDREAAAEREEKAARRVGTAATAKVSVPVAALKESKVEHVVLSGDLERYADHLPADCVTTGIDPETKAEVVVCMQPAKLKQLRDAEAAAIAKQDEAVLTAHLNLAFDRVAKLKKIGSRELAIVFAGATVEFPPEAFKAVGLRAPKDWVQFGNDRAPEQLAKFSPLDQMRVMLAGMLPNDVARLRTDADAQALLRWILEKPKLGLVADDKREAERLLTRVGKEVFAPSPASAAGEPPMPAKKPAKTKR